MNSIDLSINIAGIQMSNPIMPASGCFGYGEEAYQLIGFDLRKLGAIISKGTTLLYSQGNPQPRIWQTASGMINRIGLENPGIAVVIVEKIPFMAQFGVPVIINISGKGIEEYESMAQKLNEVAEVTAIEVNISCPNIKGGGMLFGSDEKMAFQVVRAVREQTDLPLIVKLTPNVTDIQVIARAVVKAGADAISLINTVRGSFLHNGKIYDGGLSGPAIKPIALALVAKTVQVVDVPVIGVGGISCLQDIFDFFKVGAVAVQVGTAGFKNPLVLMELIKKLEQYCQENGFQNLKELKEATK